MKTSTSTEESDGPPNNHKNVASIAMSKELYQVIAQTQATNMEDLDIMTDSMDERLINGARDLRAGYTYYNNNGKG